MRKILIACTLMLVHLAACHDDSRMVYFTAEAESGTYRNMIILPDQHASGGKYLSIQENSEVTWQVPLEKEGYYRVEIRYRTEGGDKMQYLLRNGEETGVGFDMSAEWNLCSQPFFFEAGTTALGIRSGWGAMGIDRITVANADPEFAITPGKNQFYLSHARDQVYKIDNFNQRVIRCMLDGQEGEFSQSPYPHQEYASWLTIPADAVSGTPPGAHRLQVELETRTMEATIEVSRDPREADLVVVAPDVEHGSAMLLRLPGGEFMLIDCGKSWVRDSIVVPMLRRHGVDTLHTFILTHYHPDHDGGDSGRIIRETFHVQSFIDYRTHPTGYSWEQDRVRFRILNSYADGEDENRRSLSLAIGYGDFRMVHGGDTYADNQRMILERFPGEVPADVFYANHHFHGSVLPEYIVRTDPGLVILQAQEAIYARAAYMVKYKIESEQVLNGRRRMPVETLPAIEVGTIVLRIHGGGEWTWETYREQDSAVIPGI